MKLTPHQERAMEQIQAFVKNPAKRVFVLKGYAGTGKTTLVGHIVSWLESTNLQPVLLATTGRAAKVLQNKTGFRASTLHGCIYTFESISGKDDAGGDPWSSQGGQLFLDFGLKPRLDQVDHLVYIVDEASILTHEIPMEANNMAKFGSGSLLDDFMKFVGHNKVIFVGDPCQLPPVSHNLFSGALDAQFLAQRYSIGTATTELRDIVRQPSDSGILHTAGHFRERIVSDNFEKYPKIIRPSSGMAVNVMNDEEDLLRGFYMIFRAEGFWETIMICQSNWQCARLNTQIRAIMGKGAQLEPEDMLMVVQNSYHVDLANGDQVRVDEVSFDCHRAGLDFYNVKVTALHNWETYETKLIGNLLYNDAPGISSEQMKPLFIDFDRSMKQQGISRNSEAYRFAMFKDPYLNALRAKFGYAITCHKAQGGEWPTVFLNIHKSLYGLKGASLYRWYYTAITRASKDIYVNNGWWVK